MSIPAIIMFAGIVQALFLGLLLFIHKRGPLRANRVMGLLLLCLAAEIFVPLQYLVNGWTATPHLVLIFSVAAFLNGPLLYWYVRLVTTVNYRWHGTWWLHLLPVAPAARALLKVEHRPIDSTIICPACAGSCTCTH